jgi:hypothetical protein
VGAHGSGGEERFEGNAPMDAQPTQHIERDYGAKKDKCPFPAADILVILEQVHRGEERIERNKRQDVSMSPSW